MSHHRFSLLLMLPPELILNTADHLTNRDLFSLALTSRYLGELLYRERVSRILQQSGPQTEPRSRIKRVECLVSYMSEQIYERIHDFHLLLRMVSPADLNARNSKGFNVLHYALFGGEKPVLVRKLLEAGADPNLPNSTGFAPIHIALDSSMLLHSVCRNIKFLLTPRPHFEWAKLLLKWGADLNVLLDINPRPPYYSGGTALHIAVRSWIETKRECYAKFNPLYKTEATPFRSADQLFPVVRWLLKNGADPTIKDLDGRTPRDLLNRTYEVERQLLYRAEYRIRKERSRMKEHDPDSNRCRART